MSLKEQVKEILNEADGDIISEFFHSEISDNITWDSEEIADFRKKLSDVGIKFEHVDNYGGEEMGRDYWSIYSFSNDTNIVYVKFDGWYASYHGSEYEEWFFVEPRQVQVTQFTKV